MPTDPPPITVFEVVRRAVEVCELGVVSERVDDLLQRFEDDDEPISAVPSIEERVNEVTRELDPFGDDPALAMAAAVIVYLAFRRDQFGDDAAELLRLAARAEFEGHPPPAVERWLEEAGVTV
jgi:hypothetical protein